MHNDNAPTADVINLLGGGVKGRGNPSQAQISQHEIQHTKQFLLDLFNYSLSSA
jgi:hypothetical protein